MSISGISGNAGLVAFRHRPNLQTIGDTGSQTVEASQGGQTVPQAAPASSQAAGGNSPAQNNFSVLLGGMAVGGASQDGSGRSQGTGMQPPPAPGGAGGEGSSFGSSLMSLLQSVLSGDMAGAQSAAAAIQSALGGAVSPASGDPVSGSSTSSSGTVSSMAPAAAPAASAVSPATGPGAPAQSEFMTGLNGLLTAVQSGDQAASKAAAAALVFAMRAQQDGTGLPQPAGDAGAFRNNLASLLRSVQTGDMAGARAAATAMQNALNSTESQSSSAKQAAVSSASGAPLPITPSAPSTAEVPPTAGAEQDSSQSAFMTDLKSLLAAVQAGDGDASQTAAVALLGDLKAQAEEFQTELAKVAPPLPSFGSQGSGVENVQSAYFQWS
jgi:hypothetical protein